jgi:hypothetical protein
MPRKPVDACDDRALDLDTLLHPSQLFERPADVVEDADLSLNEKRALLASWASDACAAAPAPALRKNPYGRLVTFDEIMDALRTLDKLASTAAAGDRPRTRRVSFGRGGTGAGNQGAPLH